MRDFTVISTSDKQTMLRNCPLAALIYIVCCLLFPLQHQAQPFFRNYSTDDGLPSPEVHDIIQDTDGYLWIATDNGVARFDGYGFEQFGTANGLEDCVVLYLDEDQEGRIWMQTLSGKMYYYDRDSIHSYAFNHIFQEYNYAVPNGFAFEPNGNAYFALNPWGIISVDRAGNHDVINRNCPSTFILLEKPELGKTLFAQAGSLAFKRFGIVAKQTSQLKQVAVFSDRLIRQYAVTLPAGRQTGARALSDRVHQIFSWRKGLSVFYQHRLQSKFSTPAWAAEITKIDSTFWLGLQSGVGVWAFSSFDDLVRGKKERYLEGHSVSAISRDRLGGHWFGTLDDGVYYAPNIAMPVIDPGGVLSREQVLALAAGVDGRIFIGTNSGTLYELDQSGDIELLYTTDGPIFDLLYRQKDQVIWLAGQPPLMLHPNGSREITYSSKFNRHNSNSVGTKRLLPSADTNFIYMLSRIGLEILDNSKAQVVYTTLNTPHHDRFLDAHEDADNRLWIGSVNGLRLFQDRQFRPLPIEHPALRRRIEAIRQLPDGTLALGTKGSGLVLWKDSTVITIGEAEGLTTNMVEHLVIDHHQQIWVGTLNGLNMLTRSPETGRWNVRRITMAHGLPSNEVHDLCLVGHHIYVATAGGLVRLPLQDGTKADLPKAFIERVMVNGRSTSLDHLSALSHRQRNIQLYFVCLNFKFDGAIPYRYRLTAEPKWTYTKDRSVNYAALSPGNYTFELQAQNEDGYWSDSSYVSFSIQLPYWQSWWFITLVAGGLLGIAFYWYRLRINRLKKKAELDHQINELQRAALQAQMNPHFIFNCLNAIQNCIVSGDKSSAVSYLARFAGLVRTTLHASLQSTISLEEEIRVLENYLELEKLRFGNKFTYTIEVDPTLDQFDITLPPLLVQPLVENAILHGFNFGDTPRLGQLYIAYAKAHDSLQITVRDNGIGIEQSKLNQQGKERLHHSVGISITEKRLSLQNATEENEQLLVRELVDGEGTVCGTEIIIRIKL